MWLIVALVFAGPAAAEPQVTGVRSWDHGGHTRFVLETSEPLEYQLFVLADPMRVVVDLPEVGFDLGTEHQSPRIAVGVISGFRYGLFRPGTSRLVLDLARPARVKRSFVLPPAEDKPCRLVLDLEPTSEQEFRAAARPVAPPGPEPSARAGSGVHGSGDRDARQPTIVVDAGHGGVDPGAVGVSGVQEKEIALAAARELKAMIEETGLYRVVLTRERDIFLRLRERVAIAQRAEADLFLSLHADSIDSDGLSGAHVYTLSETASDQEAAALAAKENKADIVAGLDFASYTPEVTSILVDLLRRETNNNAAGVAGLLLDAFRERGVPLLPKKPYRQAGFAVLRAPAVPSVLIELGYLSNHADESRLNESGSRRRLLEAIVHAIDRHFVLATAAGRL